MAAEHPRKQLLEEIFSALDDEQLDQLYGIVGKLVDKTDEIRKRKEAEEEAEIAAAR